MCVRQCVSPPGSVWSLLNKSRGVGWGGGELESQRRAGGTITPSGHHKHKPRYQTQSVNVWFHSSGFSQFKRSQSHFTYFKKANDNVAEEGGTIKPSFCFFSTASCILVHASWQIFSLQSVSKINLVLINYLSSRACGTVTQHGSIKGKSGNILWLFTKIQHCVPTGNTFRWSQTICSEQRRRTGEAPDTSTTENTHKSHNE